MNPLHILLIDLDSPCPTEHCLRLAEMMQHSLPVGEMRLQTTTMFPSTPTAATPDLILLRPSCEQPLEALCTFRRDWDTTPILGLFCRGWENPQRVLHTLLTGLDDFVSCPFTAIDLFPRLQRLLPEQRVEGTASPMKLAGTPLHFEFLVGASANFLRIIEKIPRLAQPDAPVLILGETGTGKELVARAIHAHSARQRQPFIPVNCGTLPDHLFENELFGHAKGAFTDASSAEKGLVAEAEGGTLLLDEIDTLSPAAQVKLLRFLQHREYRQLGSAKNRVADVRILAATNADLWQYVQAKRFREDLYHRLNVLSLVVPPLRERTEDILLLAHHFLTVYRKQHGREALRLSPSAQQKLLAYAWPGNVRELEGVVQRAVILAPSPTLQSEDIDLPCTHHGCAQDAFHVAKTQAVEHFEYAYLVELLAAHQGNISQAARAAGKDRRTFQRLLHKHHLERHAFVPSRP
jgi:DNA-binding NtrC family response regulator